jgi:hypothetical protein
VQRAGAGAVAEAIINSDESFLRIIDGYYVALLHRPGEAAGRKFWLELLQSGQPAEGTNHAGAGAVAEGFLFLQEYYAMAAGAVR